MAAGLDACAVSVLISVTAEEDSSRPSWFGSRSYSRKSISRLTWSQRLWLFHWYFKMEESQVRALFTQFSQIHQADTQHVTSVVNAKVLEVEEGMRKINTYTATVGQKVEELNRKSGEFETNCGNFVNDMQRTMDEEFSNRKIERENFQTEVRTWAENIQRNLDRKIEEAGQGSKEGGQNIQHRLNSGKDNEVAILNKRSIQRRV